MNEQITELLRKYHELNLRDDSQIFEDTRGNLFVQQAGMEQMLQVKLVNGEIVVNQVEKRPENLSPVRGQRDLRGD